MDDHRDVDDAYRMRLEESVLDAGRDLPPVYPQPMTEEEQKRHRRRVDANRQKNKIRFGL